MVFWFVLYQSVCQLLGDRDPCHGDMIFDQDMAGFVTSFSSRSLPWGLGKQSSKVPAGRGYVGCDPPPRMPVASEGLSIFLGICY